MSTKPNAITQQSKLTRLQYRRIQGGKLIEQGYRNQEIVEILGCGLTTVKLWRRIVTEHGIDALNPRPRPGRTPKLNTKQLDKLTRLLKKGATKFGYANAIRTSRRVRQLIKEQFGVAYSKAQTCRILRKIGWSPKKPIMRSKKYSAQAVEKWRRSKWPLIKKSP
jgi:transposase